MPEELLIAMATSIILSAVKNPAKKAALERSMYKIWRTLGKTFPHFKQKLEDEENA